MKSVYKKFYQNFYTRTQGYIPTAPLNEIVYPGDFFQIKNGEMIFLGNIFSSNIVDAKNVDFGNQIKLNPNCWDFSEGVTKPYSGRGTGHNAIEGEFEFSKQILAFQEIGSFFFRSTNPEALKILNWSELQNELIIKLTQTYFSFRELYLITETASSDNWTLAISSSNSGELEIATDAENFGLVDIFGHSCVKTIQSKDIEYYNRQSESKPSFFKAKKLVVQNEKLDVFVNDLIYQRTFKNKWSSAFYNVQPTHVYSNIPTTANIEQMSVLDLLPGNQLNPNTALLYFKWTDANLDDIEKLFMTYGGS